MKSKTKTQKTKTNNPLNLSQQQKTTDTTSKKPQQNNKITMNKKEASKTQQKQFA